VPRAHWFWIAFVAIPVVAGAVLAIAARAHRCEWAGPDVFGGLMQFLWLAAVACAGIAGAQSLAANGQTASVVGAVVGVVVGLIGAPMLFVFVLFGFAAAMPSC